MPSTVNDLIAAAGLHHSGSVRWRSTVPCDGSGIYLISLTEDPDSTAAAVPSAPISIVAVQQLLGRVDRLTVDHRPQPDATVVADRLGRLWLPDEVVVYIGKASRSVRQRVAQYYSTPLGNRTPHAGGWVLKTLSILTSLWVHWAESPRPELAEQQALAAFVDGASVFARERAFDPACPYPFANLEGPGGRKRHGIGGAVLRGPASGVPEPPARTTPTGGETLTQPKRRTVAGARPVTLHEEIAAILRANDNRWMTTAELAVAVARRGNYKKRDDTSDVSAFQVHGRTRQYQHLFERAASRVRLLRG
jgi:hypothetical protein